jgi:hypothetical protein
MLKGSFIIIIIIIISVLTRIEIQKFNFLNKDWQWSLANTYKAFFNNRKLATRCAIQRQRIKESRKTKYISS